MATVVAVVGGSGGVGASTFAGALAATASSALLIDLDEAGGGVDVVLGIESVPGARWSGLRVAGGWLDPQLLLDGLPCSGAVAVLAADGVPLGAEAVAQVLDAAICSTADVVVLDLPRGRCAARSAALTRCDLVVVLARADVGGLVGAHLQVGAVGAVPAGVVVRRGSVRPAEAAELVGAPLLGVLPAMPVVGGDPGRVPRSVGRLASGLLAGAARHARTAVPA